MAWENRVFILNTFSVVMWFMYDVKRLKRGKWIILTESRFMFFIHGGTRLEM